MKFEENIEEKEYGLVLAGGGTKGAYQVGVYKALKGMKINVKAVVGTSIGALNGALVLQDDLEKMLNLYGSIKLNDILSIDSKIDETKDIFSLKNIAKITKEYIEKRGISNDALRKTIEKYIDVDKIYNSDVDFGMITFSTKNKGVELFKKDIPKEKMVDFLLASSCFPIFKSQNIDGEHFFDGGLYDNMPINMLIKKGYKNIIVVDVTGMGLKRKNASKNVYIKMIKPNEKVGGTFDFNKQQMKKNIELGYLDTLKSFNKVQGFNFYFKPSEFNKMLELFSLKTIFGLECAAKIYGIDRYKIYEKDEFLEKLMIEYKKELNNYKTIKKSLNIRKNNIKNIFSNSRSVLKLINKGIGITLFMDFIEQNSLFEEKILVRATFKEYIQSAKSMIELVNTVK